MPRKITTPEKFWARVEKRPDGCWVWTGSRTQYGHGKLMVNYRTVMAHRMAWELTRGPVPDGLFVCHNCPGGDNPTCCNPDHMFLGTPQQNTLDAKAKGKLCRGDRHWSRREPSKVRRGQDHRWYGKPRPDVSGPNNVNARLTWDQVRSIREEHARGGITYAALGRRYGVSTHTVMRIIKLQTWREPAS